MKNKVDQPAEEELDVERIKYFMSLSSLLFIYISLVHKYYVNYKQSPETKND